MYKDDVFTILPLFQFSATKPPPPIPGALKGTEEPPSQTGRHHLPENAVEHIHSSEAAVISLKCTSGD